MLDQLQEYEQLWGSSTSNPNPNPNPNQSNAVNSTDIKHTASTVRTKYTFQGRIQETLVSSGGKDQKTVGTTEVKIQETVGDIEKSVPGNRNSEKRGSVVACDFYNAVKHLLTLLLTPTSSPINSLTNPY